MLGAATLMLLTLAQESKHGGTLPWIKDYEKGMREFKDAGGGAIVYFTKDG